MELLTHAPTRPAAPKVVLTFDDGTADWPDVVLPALVERGLPATFYVSTDFVERGAPFPDDGRPVSWAGLAEMAATGLATIGSHTHTPSCARRCVGDRAADEIARSVGLIEERLGSTVPALRLPEGRSRRRPPPRSSCAAASPRPRSPATSPTSPARPTSTGSGATPLTVADDDASFRRKAAGGMRLEGWLRARRDAWRA